MTACGASGERHADSFGLIISPNLHDALVVHLVKVALLAEPIPRALGLGCDLLSTKNVAGGRRYIGRNPRI